MVFFVIVMDKTVPHGVKRTNAMGKHDGIGHGILPSCELFRRRVDQMTMDRLQKIIPMKLPTADHRDERLRRIMAKIASSFF
jgi:hypothetical protein